MAGKGPHVLDPEAQADKRRQCTFLNRVTHLLEIAVDLCGLRNSPLQPKPVGSMSMQQSLTSRASYVYECEASSPCRTQSLRTKIQQQRTFKVLLAILSNGVMHSDLLELKSKILGIPCQCWAPLWRLGKLMACVNRVRLKDQMTYNPSNSATGPTKSTSSDSSPLFQRTYETPLSISCYIAVPRVPNPAGKSCAAQIQAFSGPSGSWSVGPSLRP